ncbi:MAG: hypothetical protein WCG47_17530 [Dermatophilaceae bacterium]
MKTHLLFPDRDPRTEDALDAPSEALVRDLGLDTLFETMSSGDPFLREVASRTVLTPLTNIQDIRWRQAVLQDCLGHPQAIRSLHGLAIAGLESQRNVRGWLLSGRHPSSILDYCIQKLRALLDPLRALRQFADDHAGHFGSAGLRNLLDGISADLSDEYFVALREHLRRLSFPTGVVMTAELGPGCQGTNVILRKPRSIKRTWRDWLGLSRPDALTYRLPERDESGARALSELRDRGVNLVANALAQSTDHILSFFALLRWETGFYVACLNLHDTLRRRGLSTALPEPALASTRRLRARGLYEVCLGLRIGTRVVGNDLQAEGISLVMITGANQGGKSTLLRSIGLAQLMMQGGMFVAADSFHASIAAQLHTHFAREEDATMHSGKLDEELTRMSHIVDAATAADLVLFNESFASTNEREGSRIARQIIDGLTEAGIRVIYVTHMYDLANGLAQMGRADALFLRPERLEDGRRTFRVVPGGPTPTSHGADLYEKVFGRP